MLCLLSRLRRVSVGRDGCGGGTSNQQRTVMRHLLLTELWFPHIGGSIRLFDELYYKRFPPDEPLHVVAGAVSGDAQSDAFSARQVTRFDPTRYIWMRPESLASYARMWSAAARVALRDRTEV